MADAWLERCRRDLLRLDRAQAGLAFIDACAAWLADAAWRDDAARVPAPRRRQALVELARWAHAENAGGYATYIDDLVDGAGIVAHDRQRAPLVARHLEHWFVSLSDVLSFRCEAESREALARVSLRGTRHLDRALRAGRGVMIVSVTQSHPSFGLNHPRYAGVGLSVVANIPAGDETHASPFLPRWKIWTR